MHHCSIPGCQSRSGRNKELSFCRAPARKSENFVQWMLKTRIKKITRNTRICSKHFKNGKPSGRHDIPSIFPWSKNRRSPIARPFNDVVRERKNVKVRLEVRMAGFNNDHDYCLSTRSSCLLSSLTGHQEVARPASTLQDSEQSIVPKQLHIPFRIECIQDYDKLILLFMTTTLY